MTLPPMAIVALQREPQRCRQDGHDEVRLHVVLVEELPGPGLRQPTVVAEEAGQPTAADDLAGRRGWIRSLSGTQLMAIC